MITGVCVGLYEDGRWIVGVVGCGAFWVQKTNPKHVRRPSEWLDVSYPTAVRELSVLGVLGCGGFSANSSKEASERGELVRR